MLAAMWRYWYIFFAMSLLLAGCLRRSTTNLTYPYQATPEREAVIRNGYPKVTIGMPTADVHRLIGQPDEVLPLYEPVVKNGKQIGFTHWYLIRRAGEQNPAEKVVRVSVDLNDRVTRVDHWGVEGGS